MGGFECCTHRNLQGRRLDLISASRHEEFAELDYRRCQAMGLHTVRDGVRWHLIETRPYVYDFASLQRQAEAVKQTGIQVIWDLFHYGYPDDLDILSEAFIERFTQFAVAACHYLKEVLGSAEPLVLCTVNEISFFAWIAGDMANFYPYLTDSGYALKKQLALAAIKATAAIRTCYPDSRFVQCEPAIRIFPAFWNRALGKETVGHNNSQYEAFDMLAGRIEAELGGSDACLDIIGVNFYPKNQWVHPTGETVSLQSPYYKSFHKILEIIFKRYRRPILISETGTEDHERAGWFEYIAQQAEIAKDNGVPVLGICLYPILNHPGWDDDRHCRHGLWDYADDAGFRNVYLPLAEKIAKTKLPSVFV